MNFKKCTGPCGRFLEETEANFALDKSRNTLKNKCRKCVSAYLKIYRENNKEHLKLIKKEYYDNNKNEIAIKKREFYKEHRDEKLEKQKQYYLNNKTAKKEYDKEYISKNKDKIIKRRKKYYQDNREEKLKIQKEYYNKNRDEILIKTKIYTEKNKPKKRIYMKGYKQKRRKNDPVFKLREIVSRQINYYIKRIGSSKGGISIVNYLGYTIEELKLWLEAQWEPWMNWDNHGAYNKNKRTWHIDHIIPQSKLPYDSMEHPNFKKCWALENLRPLEATENMKKSNKILER